LNFDLFLCEENKRSLKVFKLECSQYATAFQRNQKTMSNTQSPAIIARIRYCYVLVLSLQIDPCLLRRCEVRYQKQSVELFGVYLY